MLPVVSEPQLPSLGQSCLPGWPHHPGQLAPGIRPSQSLYSRYCSCLFSLISISTHERVLRESLISPSHIFIVRAGGGFLPFSPAGLTVEEHMQCPLPSLPQGRRRTSLTPLTADFLRRISAGLGRPAPREGVSLSAVCGCPLCQ